VRCKLEGSYPATKVMDVDASSFVIITLAGPGSAHACIWAQMGAN